MRIPVTEGQVNYEFHYLLEKLKIRNPKTHAELLQVRIIEVNPIFFVIKGDLEEWEKLSFLIRNILP
ncbi:MAG: hypothetical protein RXQ80_07880 [Sulfolobaceae archaeon]